MLADDEASQPLAGGKTTLLGGSLGVGLQVVGVESVRAWGGYQDSGRRSRIGGPQHLEEVDQNRDLKAELDHTHACHGLRLLLE